MANPKPKLSDYEAGVKAAQSRAVRIVKAEIKRVTLDQQSYRAFEKALVLEILSNLLADVQCGR